MKPKPTWKMPPETAQSYLLVARRALAMARRGEELGPGEQMCLDIASDHGLIDEHEKEIAMALNVCLNLCRHGGDRTLAGRQSLEPQREEKDEDLEKAAVKAVVEGLARDGIKAEISQDGRAFRYVKDPKTGKLGRWKKLVGTGEPDEIEVVDDDGEE